MDADYDQPYVYVVRGRHGSLKVGYSHYPTLKPVISAIVQREKEQE